MSRKLLITEMLIVLVLLPPLAKVAIDVKDRHVFLAMLTEGKQLIRNFEAFRPDGGNSYRAGP